MKKLASGSFQRKFPLVRYVCFALVSIFFIYLNYHEALVESDAATSQAKLLLVNGTIAIPEIIIWAIAFRGALRFKHYATVIKDGKDGKGLTLIASALLLMALYT